MFIPRRRPKPNYSCWDANGNGVVGNVLGDYRSCADECVFANLYSGIDCAPGAYRCELSDPCVESGPFAMSSRMLVIREGYIGRDEDVVFNDDSSGDEYEGSNFAVRSNRDAFFNIDE